MKAVHCRLLALLLAVLALGISPALSVFVHAESVSPESAIHYSVNAGSALSLDVEDFRRFFQGRSDGDSLRYITFRTNSSVRTSNGEFYVRYGGTNPERFSRDSLERADFYYDDAAYGDFPLEELSFVASERGGGASVTLEFTAHGRLQNVSGTLSIAIHSPEPVSEGTIFYEVLPGETITFSREDFNVFYRRKYVGLLRSVLFSCEDLSGGSLFSGARTFDSATLGDFRFYYSNSRYGDYALDNLSFMADADFTSPVTLFFRAYGDADGLEEQYAAGSVVIRPSVQSGAASAGERRTDKRLRLTAEPFGAFSSSMFSLRRFADSAQTFKAP